MPHYLGKKFTNVAKIDNFSYDKEGENIANTTVYKVTLDSRERV